MRRDGVALLGALLSMSLGGCGGCGKNPADDFNDMQGWERSENPADEFGGISKVMQEWERNVERARAGEPVDFDGDGFEEYLQWTDEKGIIHVEIKSPAGSFSWVSKLHPDGTKIILYDANGNGKLNKRVEENADSTIYFIASNGDGVFDERIVVTFDFENGEYIHVRVFEKLNSNGTWEETQRETKPLRQGMPFFSKTQENFLQGFVEPQYATSNTGGSRPEFQDIGNKLRLQTGGTGACNPEQAAKIREAFDTIFSKDSKVLQCLSEANGEIAGRLREVNRTPHANIDCVAHDKREQASVERPWDEKHLRQSNCIPGEPQCTLSINPETFETLKSKPNDFMSVMLHEYLHLLGFSGDKDHNAGIDMVHSCGRYCANCSQVAGGLFTQSDQINCQKCAAGDPQREAMCKRKIIVSREPAPSYPCGFNNINNQTELVFCSRFRCIQAFNCDGKYFPVHPPSILVNDKCNAGCCEECHADHKLMMCDARMLNLPDGTHDSCNKEPPFCSGGIRNP